MSEILNYVEINNSYFPSGAVKGNLCTNKPKTALPKFFSLLTLYSLECFTKPYKALFKHKCHSKGATVLSGGKALLMYILKIRMLRFIILIWHPVHLLPVKCIEILKQLRIYKRPMQISESMIRRKNAWLFIILSTLLQVKENTEYSFKLIEIDLTVLLPGNLYDFFTCGFCACYFLMYWKP